MVTDLRPEAFDIYYDLWGEVLALTHLPRHAQATTPYTCLGKASNLRHLRGYVRYFAEKLHGTLRSIERQSAYARARRRSRRTRREGKGAVAHSGGNDRGAGPVRLRIWH